MPAVDWSPDDRSLAFTTADGRLYVVDVDNSDLRPLGDDSLNRQDPAWSPNGSLIAFHGEGASTGIYVIGSDGSGEIKVSTGPSWPISLRLPSWSPDGQRLLYHVGNPDENDIAIATRTGSRKSRLDRFRTTNGTSFLAPFIGGLFCQSNTRVPRAL